MLGRLARRTTQCRGGAIDVADDAVREHVVAVTDVACLAIRGRRGEPDPVEIVQPDDPSVVLADAGIVHDHAAHAPFRRIEGIVPAAIGPGDDDVRAVFLANERAARNRQDLCTLPRSVHRLSSRAAPCVGATSPSIRGAQAVATVAAKPRNRKRKWHVCIESLRRRKSSPSPCGRGSGGGGATRDNTPYFNQGTTRHSEHETPSRLHSTPRPPRPPASCPALHGSSCGSA